MRSTLASSASRAPSLRQKPHHKLMAVFCPAEHLPSGERQVNPMRIECYLVPVILDQYGVSWVIRDLHTHELLDWAETIDEAVRICDKNHWRIFVISRGQL